MEPKKYKKYDLRNKSGMFFNIGMSISILLVITAFEWKFYVDDKKVELTSDIHLFDDIIEVPRTEHLPPEIPVQSPAVVEVPDDEEIPEILMDFDAQITEEDVIEDILYIAPPAEEETEEIVKFPDTQAEPVDGLTAYYKAIGEALKYPKQAERMGTQGTVYVQFLVDKDGNISDIQIMKGIGGGCDEEAIRVIKEGPKWKPGRQRALPVKSWIRLPIRFRLQ